MGRDSQSTQSKQVIENLETEAFRAPSQWPTPIGLAATTYRKWPAGEAFWPEIRETNKQTNKQTKKCWVIHMEGERSRSKKNEAWADELRKMAPHPLHCSSKHLVIQVTEEAFLISDKFPKVYILHA